MKNLIAFSFLLISVSAYAFIRSPLLAESDLEFQKTDNTQGPALGSTLLQEGGWASYNQWQCFSLEDAIMDCAVYDDGALVPSIRIETPKHTYLFDTHVEDKLSCSETLEKWNELAGNGTEICVFAAQMPDVDFGNDEQIQQSLWYINRIKMSGGYWNLFEESQEIK